MSSIRPNDAVPVDRLFRALDLGMQQQQRSAESTEATAGDKTAAAGRGTPTRRCCATRATLASSLRARWT